MSAYGQQLTRDSLDSFNDSERDYIHREHDYPQKHDVRHYQPRQYGSNYADSSTTGMPYTQAPNLEQRRPVAAPAYGSGPYEYDSSAVQSPPFLAGNTSRNHRTHDRLNLSNSAPHSLPSALSLKPHRSSSGVPIQADGSAAPGIPKDSASDQDDGDLDSLFDDADEFEGDEVEDDQTEHAQTDDGEVEESDANDETEEDDVDNGEFVVHDVENISHIEKPGKIRENNGLLEWQDPKTKEWQLAVIHHNIREELILRTQALHPHLGYDHPHQAGTGPHDVTSFYKDYQSWGPERGDRPKILYEFDRRPKPATKAHPGYMMFDGMVVLNHQNNPILNWNIPATLSSTTPGAFMEAWKRMFGLEQEDMRARMVRYTFTEVNGCRVRQALSDKNTIINMPMQRFRGKAGCIAWIQRQQKIRAGTLKLMRTHGIDPETNGNSIEAFGRDLTAEEEKEVKKGDEAHFSQRARSVATRRSLAGTPRKRNHQEIDEYIDDGSGQQTADSLAPANPMHGGQDSPPRKRQNMIVGEDAASTREEVRPQTQAVNIAQEVRASMRAQDKSKHTTHRKRIDEVHGKKASKRGFMGHLDVEEQSLNEDRPVNEPIQAREDRADSEMSDREKNETVSRLPSDGLEQGHPGVDLPLQKRGNATIGLYGEREPPFKVTEAFGSDVPWAKDLKTHRQNMREYLGEVSGEERYWDPDTMRPEMLGDFEDIFGNEDSQINVNGGRWSVHGEVEAVEGRVLPQQTSNGNHDLTQGHKLRGGPAPDNVAQRLSHEPDTLPNGDDPSPPQHQATTRRPEHQKAARIHQRVHSHPQATSWNLNAAGNRGSVPPPRVDYRKVRPANQLECQNIQTALRPTREAFFEYTGAQAPQTDPTQSYMTQWHRLHSVFNEYDWVGESQAEVPYLLQLPEWHTSLRHAPSHVEDSLYYEAWHRGHRTPIVRLANGQQIDLPGKFLERIGSYPDAERWFLLEERYSSLGFEIAGKEDEEEEEL